MHSLSSLRATPSSLASHYRRFRVADRVLLTGHSHQAWPDCAERGHLEAFEDAASLVDGKWEKAFQKADRVRAGFARLLDDADGHIALAPNTHDALIRFLSALPLAKRPRLVTTDGEFHTIRRQLDRLAEVGLDVVRQPAQPVSTLAERLTASLAQDPARTSAVLVSSVLFTSAEIVPHLGQLAAACESSEVSLLVDAYHHLNVVPFSVAAEGLSGAFIVGGGYKYCQLGEGNCFLRFPRDCTHRPVVTGWFSEFAWLERQERPPQVPYGAGPARYAGSTYDPTSHYRAAAVFDFFEDQRLTVGLLRQLSQHQTQSLAHAFDRLDLDPSVLQRDRNIPPDRLAGFLTLRSERAAEIQKALRKRDVFVDHRGDALRMGPAPYVSDHQIERGIALLGQVVQSLAP